MSNSMTSLLLARFSTKLFLKGAVKHSTLKYLGTMAACALFARNAPILSAKDIRGPSPPVAIADDKGSPIYGVNIPGRYR